MVHFGEILSELRKDNHLTQKQLAAKLHVSVGTISNYENGVHSPDIEKLFILAELFDVTIDYLLGRTTYNISSTLMQKKTASGIKMYDILQALSNMDSKSLQAFSIIITTHNGKCNTKDVE